MLQCILSHNIITPLNFSERTKKAILVRVIFQDKARMPTIFCSKSFNQIGARASQKSVNSFGLASANYENSRYMLRIIRTYHTITHHTYQHISF